MLDKALSVLGANQHSSREEYLVLPVLPILLCKGYGSKEPQLFGQLIVKLVTIHGDKHLGERPHSLDGFCQARNKYQSQLNDVAESDYRNLYLENVTVFPMALKGRGKYER